MPGGGIMRPLIIMLIWLVVLGDYKIRRYSKGGDLNEPKLARYEASLSTCRNELKLIKRHLLDYQKEHGSFPTNDESLLAVNALADSLPVFEDTEYVQAGMYPSTTDYAVLSSYGMPFVYENRIGLSKKAFLYSPIYCDSVGKYTIKVADDVYVYDVGMIRLYEEYSKIKNIARGNPFIFNSAIVTVISSILILGLIVLFVFSKTIQPKIARYVTVFLLIAIMTSLLILLHLSSFSQGGFTITTGFMLLFALWISITTPGITRAARIGVFIILGVLTSFFVVPDVRVNCYLPAPVGRWRRKDLYPQYIELLAKYRDHEVIKPATFRKIKNALDSEFEKENY